jgi:selenocysteine lyase/cysteine desulfurase
MNSRKQFLRQLGATALISAIPAIAGAEKHGTALALDKDDFMHEGDPTDEKFWKQIARKYYDVSRDYINLENGYYGIQPTPVLTAFQKNIQKANHDASRFARKEFPAIQAGIKKQLATFLAVSEEEIIITRNATEALNIAIQGYNFKEGDEVIINQLDYFSMIEAFRMLEKRGHIKVKAFEMPLLPANDEEIVDIYRKEITAATKVILLTHVSNINGLIIPVSKITAMAKEKGIDVICDSAHALGHIPFDLPSLGPDFIGLNLHKWIGNPVGAGVLFVRKNRIREMKPLFGDVNTPSDKIEKLAHFGTTPFAVIMTIPESLKFHQLIGVEKITTRLRYLSSIWMNEFASIPNVELVSPGNMLTCAIASFRIKGKTAAEVSDYLFNKHKVLTVARSLGKQGCVRVTPAVYTFPEEIQELIKAIKVF